MSDRLVAAQSAGSDEEQLLATLRPTRLADFIGQDRQRERLGIGIEASRQLGEPLDHLLVTGPPGLGKTTLAHIVTKEMEGRLTVAFGPALQKPGDLVGILQALQANDVLFIDEIHRLPPSVEEYLYVPMEDGRLDIMLGQGQTKRPISYPLPPFTLVGATTHKGSMSAPLRERFLHDFVLDFYSEADLTRVALRSALVMQMPIDPEAAVMLARTGRGTPRIVNRLLRRVRDVKTVERASEITPAIVDRTLRLHSIDPDGLDDLDRRFLQTLDRLGGGPAGVASIAATMREEQVTIEEAVEPYLLYRGLIVRTGKGRKLTQLGFRRLRGELLTDVT